MSTLAGQTIGKYKLLERRGRGGMAEVYKAHHPRLDRTVAVKILHGYLAEGEDFLGRFEREARAVAVLRHPHIVQIHDFDVQDDNYYMVMEYIAGGTLQDKMTDLQDSGRYMPCGQVLSIIKQVAGALDYAHKKGIIHRDIKPSNILLDEAGEAYLADFGIARMISTTQFTSTGALIGTPTYMSPEQSKGLELTGASDIYSLGVILYELLTGRAPFIADTPLAVIQKHISEQLPPPSRLRPALPARVEDVIAKALAKDVSSRFQAAGDLARSLEQALTPAIIADLDSGKKMKKKKEPAVQPTELIEEAGFPGHEPSLTVAMGEETRAGITGEPAREPEKPAVEPPPTREKITPGPKEEKKPIQVRKFTLSGLWAWLRSRPIIIGFVAIILVAVLGITLSGIFSQPSCSDPEECGVLAVELKEQGKYDESLATFDKAIEMVPVDEHRQNAGLWCQRAAVMELLNRFDEMTASMEMCGAWERGE